MKIGIDARWIFKELSGIGSYTRELIRHLARLERAHKFVVYFSDPGLRDRTVAETDLGSAPNFSTCLLPFGLFSIRNQLRLPGMLAEAALDVFHSPNYMIPLRAFPRGRPGRIRCVTTIHDLIPLMFPAYAPRAWKRRFFLLYRWLMHEVAVRSDLVLTDSRSSREDMVRYLRLPPERVLAIPLGVLPKFQPTVRTDADATGWTPGGARAEQTILWVGRADPYKNLVGLIEAFAALRKQYQLPVELRIVGPKDRRYPEASRRAASLGVEDAVMWLGYLPDDRLVSEYQNADVFVQPSWYEGFGLPVLEAFACGTPVICSNKGSLPEVAGGAALIVQPQDMIGLTEAMRRVLIDSRLARDMRERGLRQAQKFTWEATARMTLEAYKKVMAGK
ncbi:MAG: glycosyltransferase family 4 protein [Verrucomicrobia bacterium]|nr:glycosyltransferase family 4 protein [Verrucomicrobiota bacterium]MBU1734433.1 glycosyltransferase family 4 protein [Verrucomicrobiota bacterium]MBU1857339.1 glycosyltransferase family 4 protein [Verrucomicrobiota bacterium]